MGSFSLEGAKFSGEEKPDKNDYFLIVIETSKKNRFTLRFQSSKTRDAWLEAFKRANERSQLDKKFVLDNWNAEEAVCLRCVGEEAAVVTNISEEEEAEEDVPVPTEEGSGLESVVDIPLVDVNGRTVKFGTLLERQPSIFILLRHFGCMVLLFIFSSEFFN